MPARLGVGFRWLLALSWTTKLGDGIAIAAGPLLVASQNVFEMSFGGPPTVVGAGCAL